MAQLSHHCVCVRRGKSKGLALMGHDTGETEETQWERGQD